MILEEIVALRTIGITREIKLVLPKGEVPERMTVNVDLRPELEARLVARAGSAGQSLGDFIRRLLEREAAEPETSGVRALTGPEKAQAFRAWAKSFRATLPILSPESVSRESMYQRD